jgi:ribonuclease HI
MNKDLRLQLHDLISKVVDVTWKWVKAHATSKHNNAVDLLARRAATKIQANLPVDYIPPIKIDDNPQRSLFG